jgi:hypothetical protein
MLTALAIAALLLPPGAARQPGGGDPDTAKLVTEDIARFWAVIDRATPDSLAELLQRDYIDAGTAGVRAFTPARIVSGKALAAAVIAHPGRYSHDVRLRTLRVRELERRIRAPLYALKHLYPPAIFPDVYFVIGRRNSGGTATDAGLMIGAEMYADSDEALANLPHVVAHEWAHFNQTFPPLTTLLAQAIQEGSADLLAELASGAHTNPRQHAFGDAHEAELWRLFQAVMHEPAGSTAVAGWLYGGSVLPNGPPDLAYYVGYKICDAYYRRAADKRQALADILTIRDFGAFLAASGYRGPHQR